MKYRNNFGKKIGNWTIIDAVIIKNRVQYIFKCNCGNEKIARLSSISLCKVCAHQLKIQEHIGKKNGRITCIGSHKYGDRYVVLVRCDCGREYGIQSYSKFLKTVSCHVCCQGYMPQMKAGNTILLERLSNKLWRKECKCGVIFIGKAKKPDCGRACKIKLMKNALHKVGMKYGNLKVKKIYEVKNNRVWLLLRCKCGNEVVRQNGTEFDSFSCGCLSNVPTGEKCHLATLKDCEVASMKELYKTGIYNEKQLAGMFKKKECYIKRILRGFVWKDV